jgi:hypothetical protein
MSSMGPAWNWSSNYTGNDISALLLVRLLKYQQVLDIVHHPRSPPANSDMTNCWTRWPAKRGTVPRKWITAPKKKGSRVKHAAVVMIAHTRKALTPSTMFSQLRGASIAAPGSISADNSSSMDCPSCSPALAATPVGCPLRITWSFPSPDDRQIRPSASNQEQLIKCPASPKTIFSSSR